MAVPEALYSQGFSVTQDIKDAFDSHGFFIIRSLFSEPEISHLLSFFSSSPDIQEHCYGRDDGRLRKTKVCLWNYAGDDVADMVSRSRRIVETFEALLGGEELYHYHSKLMMKEAETGGQHVWHQDYGYWCENGCPTPNMGSVFLALDPAIRENGCLQVLAGSHQLGTLATQLIGSGVTQRGAQLGLVEQAKDKCSHHYVELAPGDAVFFHSNLLHTSEQNQSKLRRYAMICAYNQRRNSPDREHHHPLYHPLIKVDDSALLACTNLKSSTDKWYFNPKEDISIRPKINP